MKRGWTLGLLAAAAVAGCGDIIGLGDYDLDGSVDAFVPDTGTGDAQPDAQPDVKNDVIVADVVIPPSCGPTTAVCVPELPTGWAWAVYDPDARPACASGYAAPKDVEEGIDAGPASCACGCTTNNPSCNAGNLTITGGTNGSCNNISNQTDVADGGCNALTQFTTNGASISVTGPTPTGGSCTPSPSQTVPSVGYDHQGRTCDMTATPGDAGCSAGNVCVPNPAPFAMCISQAGAQTCPAGYPTQHVVGSALTDTRGCTACGCTFDAGACLGTATLYTNTFCTTNAQAIPADGTCTQVNGNRTWRGYSYAPTTSASCAGTAVSPDGGVVFSDLTTICCK